MFVDRHVKIYFCSYYSNACVVPLVTYCNLHQRVCMFLPIVYIHNYYNLKVLCVQQRMDVL